eukprot:1384610-Amorphochlora_amoeboformis.AAC.2
MPTYVRRTESRHQIDKGKPEDEYEGAENQQDRRRGRSHGPGPLNTTFSKSSKFGTEVFPSVEMR